MIYLEDEERDRKLMSDKEIIDFLEKSGESFIKIDRYYNPDGSIFFGVRTCSNQLEKQIFGTTIREAMSSLIDRQAIPVCGSTDCGSADLLPNANVNRAAASDTGETPQPKTAAPVQHLVGQHLPEDHKS